MEQNIKSKKNTFVWKECEYSYYDLAALKEDGVNCDTLPFIIRILLESFLRRNDSGQIAKEQLLSLSQWEKKEREDEIPFFPERIILQDFTGVPVILDLAALRVYMKQTAQKRGMDEGQQNQFANSINPEIPVDLVIDHSVQIDCYGNENALYENQNLEMERNKERYQFLEWAKDSFSNFSVIPPATGIVHQVNMEYLAKVVQIKKTKDEVLLYPDTLVGTDSHTTMINGLGVLGWGVGGIEAEAAMLGLPSYIPYPKVVGVEFIGKRQRGVTATDLALYVTKQLRAYGVVDTFVEYFGKGVKELSVADRTTIANMAPEYGATSGFFPADEKVLEYLKLTGRDAKNIELFRFYMEKNHLLQTYEEEITYSDKVVIDLDKIVPAIAGPKRPQDFLELKAVKDNLKHCMLQPSGNQGYGLKESELKKKAVFYIKQQKVEIKTGDILIAAITSCTNTSNPAVMLAAGLLAKNAVEKGLHVPAYVKTSLAPGSKVVTAYLKKSGLLSYLEQLGFYVAGYGCTTCIGNSGPLLPEIEEAVIKGNLFCASVLSGNRNFEGRVHPLVKANYLASPPLVVAYALAGTMFCDLTQEPLGMDIHSKPVFLKDIWPSDEEIEKKIHAYVTPDLYQDAYTDVYENNKLWNQMNEENDAYEIPKDSAYIKIPPFLDSLKDEIKTRELPEFENLSVLAKFKDSITTDHISPAGTISADSPAGTYLNSKGILKKDFNTYGSRRGNDEVMVRGTFANIRIRNEMAEGKEGGYTTYLPTGELMYIYDASKKYKSSGKSLLVLAGKDYGMGSSRDWAAKGTALLGVKVVLAESYERIHRSNLTMMGILPLEYLKGETADSLGLTGKEQFSFYWNKDITALKRMNVEAKKEDGKKITFEVRVRLDSKVEAEYLKLGGILPYVAGKKTERFL